MTDAALDLPSPSEADFLTLGGGAPVLATVPLLIAGFADPSRAVWASAICDEPGFASVVGPRSLVVATDPPFGDPLFSALHDGMAIGLLAADFVADSNLVIHGRAYVRRRGFIVRHAVANRRGTDRLPARHWALTEAIAAVGALRERVVVTDLHVVRDLVSSSELFFLVVDDSLPPQPVIGRIGFARAEGARTLRFDDKARSMARDARVEILFIDFLTGSTFQLSGRRRADRLRLGEHVIHLDQGYFTAAALPLTWHDARTIPGAVGVPEEMSIQP